MARPITYDPELALDRALDLFWTHGYRAVSVDDVVKGTGLNRHSLYARYGSKYGLFRAALGRYGQQAVGTVRDILEGPGTPRQRLQQLFALRDPEQADDFWCLMMERGCLGLRAASELRSTHPELTEGTRAFERLLVELLTELVAEGQAQGDFKSARDAGSLAQILAGGFMSPLVLSPSAERNRAFLSLLD